jgi:hypothetical protein
MQSQSKSDPKRRLSKRLFPVPHQEFNGVLRSAHSENQSEMDYPTRGFDVWDWFLAAHWLMTQHNAHHILMIGMTP